MNVSQCVYTVWLLSCEGRVKEVGLEGDNWCNCDSCNFVKERIGARLAHRSSTQALGSVDLKAQRGCPV